VKLSRVVLGSAIAVSLAGGGLMAIPAAAQDDCGVAIYGGDVLNQTVIDLNANGGTAIADASGGFGNEATTGGRNVDDVDIASAGNGGVASAAANGGAISTGNINSGGNVGNAISVGDTHCAVMAEKAPAEKAPAEKAPAKEEKAKEEKAEKAEVVALPDTGVGIGDASALFALITSAGAAAASLGLRRR
jgi:hypothetical protein